MKEEDIQKYMKMLGDGDMSEDQRREFVEALFPIVQHFVDLAWGDDPVSLAKKASQKER